MAGQIHAVLKRDEHCNRSPDSLHLLIGEIPDFQKSCRQFRRCIGQQWRLAAIAKRHQLVRQLCRMELMVSRLANDLTPRASRHATAHEILSELREIEEEFGDVRYDKRSRFLCATTESITLEGLDLGRFDIRIDLALVAADSDENKLEVIALEPNPCALDDLIVHPHVNDGRVCLGDATEPLRKALREHRIADAFQIVAAVLRTYGSDSPYCAIESWNGRACDDCGVIASEDASFYCELCDKCFCDDCIGGCRDCGESMCLGCLSSCAICDDRICADCQSFCDGCGELACASCLENELCPSCLEDSEKEEIENDAEQEAIENQASKFQEATDRVSKPGSAVVTI